jgi:hypothetical protein
MNGTSCRWFAHESTLRWIHELVALQTGRRVGVDPVERINDTGDSRYMDAVISDIALYRSLFCATDRSPHKTTSI